jgi:hypothetical protein
LIHSGNQNSVAGYQWRIYLHDGFIFETIGDSFFCESVLFLGSLGRIEIRVSFTNQPKKKKEKKKKKGPWEESAYQRMNHGSRGVNPKEVLIPHLPFPFVPCPELPT